MAGFGDALTQAYLQTQQQRFNEALQLADYILRQQTGQEQIRQFNVGQEESRRQFDKNFEIKERETALSEKKHQQDVYEFEQAKPEREAKVKGLELSNREAERKAALLPYEIYNKTLESMSKVVPTYGAAAALAEAASGLPPQEAAQLTERWAKEIAVTNPPSPLLDMVSGFQNGGLFGMAAALAQANNEAPRRVLRRPTLTAETAAAKILQAEAKAALDKARAENVRTIDKQLGEARLANEKMKTKLSNVELKYANSMAMAKVRNLLAGADQASSAAELNRAKVKWGPSGGGGANAIPANQRMAMSMYRELNEEVGKILAQLATAESYAAQQESLLRGAEAELSAWKTRESEGDLTGAAVTEFVKAQARIAGARAALDEANRRVNSLRASAKERQQAMRDLGTMYQLPGYTGGTAAPPPRPATQPAAVSMPSGGVYSDIFGRSAPTAGAALWPVQQTTPLDTPAWQRQQPSIKRGQALKAGIAGVLK
jgi:hypothetical protein